MDRRDFNRASLGFGALVLTTLTQRAWALSLANLSNQDASAGVKAALEQGALAAVALLGQNGGFLNNDKVRIPLPGYLQDGERLLRLAGQGKYLDELVTSMNHAAEAAVPLGKDLLVKSVKEMTVTDAKQILTGGDNSVTDFFATKTRTPLGETFLPIVSETTQKVGVARTYNRIAGRAATAGLIKPGQASIEQYVTDKTLDGLYTIIGEEERKIRQDPVGTGSAILKNVFGGLK